MRESLINSKSFNSKNNPDLLSVIYIYIATLQTCRKSRIGIKFGTKKRNIDVYSFWDHIISSYI